MQNHTKDLSCIQLKDNINLVLCENFVSKEGVVRICSVVG